MTDDPEEKLPKSRPVDGRGPMEAQLRSIRRELDQEFSVVLTKELSALDKISGFLESVEKKLEKHYAGAFPKRCQTCGKTYHTKEEYIRETEGLRKNNGVVFDEIGLQEFRNCGCGSTLVVWTREDRRDGSSYGIERRRLFDECMKKLTEIWLSGDGEIVSVKGYGPLSEQRIRDLLRDLFARSC